MHMCVLVFYTSAYIALWGERERVVLPDVLAIESQQIVFLAEM